MKITRSKPKFEPVVITLENEEEVRGFCDLVSYGVSPNSKVNASAHRVARGLRVELLSIMERLK